MWESCPVLKTNEEKDQGDVSSFNLDISLNPKDQVKFPTTKPIAIDTSTSSIQFPIGSPEHPSLP
jgi:hypothetical protein